jgi:uncharacterized tellurite resistance protein B-like protein
MIDRLKSLFAGGEAARAPGARGPDELHVAAAALLVEAACMDGHFDEGEKRTITSALQTQFGLDENEAEDLVRAGIKAQDDSNQLYAFTRIIKDRFEHADKVRMIEMLWEVALADGDIHHYESNLVRRVAGLLYVPDPESGAARKRVLQRLKSSAANECPPERTTLNGDNG